MARMEIVIRHRQGLHARPAAEFAQAARQFAADVSIIKGGRTANAKSLLALLSLAVRKGDKVVLAADGIDDQAAIDHLAKLVASS